MPKLNFFSEDFQRRRRQSNQEFSNQMLAELDRKQNSLFTNVISVIQDLQQFLSKQSLPADLADALKKLPEKLIRDEKSGKDLQDYDDLEVIFEGLRQKLFSQLDPQLLHRSEIRDFQRRLASLEEETKQASWLMDKFTTIFGYPQMDAEFAKSKLNLEGIQRLVDVFTTGLETRFKEFGQFNPKSSPDVYQSKMDQLSELQLETQEAINSMSAFEKQSQKEAGLEVRSYRQAVQNLNLPVDSKKPSPKP